MIKTIIEAAQNFCLHQIREEYKLHEGISKKTLFISYIDIDTNTEKRYRVYLACDENILQNICTIFLEEQESETETLIDMILETTNLIVGSAKVIAETSNNPYTINTPYFEKRGLFDFDYDQSKIINIHNSELMIATKELNG